MTMSKQELTTRIARWALQLEDFDYIIEHRNGTQMRHVDALSRNPISMIVTRGILAKISAAQRADKNLNTITTLLKSNQNYDDYFVENDILYKEKDGRRLLVLPKVLQMETIRKLHEENGHFSARKVEELVEREYWIPDLRKKINKCIENCIPCIIVERKRGKQEGFLNTIEKGDVPLDTYHIDHIGPMPSTKKSYNYLLVVIDGFSKFTWIYPVKSTTTEETISKLESQADTFGNPRRLISDRGTAFTSGAFEQYCKDRNITHTLITTGIPRGNGQVERTNRTIIPVLTKMSVDNPAEWHKHVAKVQRALNCTYQRSVDTTPFQLMFGTKMRDPSLLQIADLIMVESAEMFQEEREQTRKDAKEQIEKIQIENRKAYNKKRKKARLYSEGDVVAIKRTQYATQLPNDYSSESDE